MKRYIGLIIFLGLSIRAISQTIALNPENPHYYQSEVDNTDFFSRYCC